MYYLSESYSLKQKDLSQRLIAQANITNKDGKIIQNGVKYEFNVAIKVFNQLSSALCDYNMNQPNIYKITKEIVDTLQVLWHPINALDIKWEEIENVGWNKISRTYNREFKVTDYNPTKDFNTELNKLARKVVNKNGLKFQIGITIEELGELAQELSKHNRNKLDRDHLIEELYDVWYTLRYPILALQISKGRLNSIARFRIPEIQNKTLLTKER